jgi:quinol monooxygenase YgiN
MMPRNEAGGKQMSRIMIVVEFEVKPEHKGAFVVLIKNHAQLSRAEDGCQQFDVLLPIEEANKIMLVEAWRDAAALDVHSKLPRMAQNRETYTPWLTGRKATRCMAD